MRSRARCTTLAESCPWPVNSHGRALRPVKSIRDGGPSISVAAAGKRRLDRRDLVEVATNRSAAAAPGDRARTPEATYRRLKARLLEQPPAPKQLLRIGTLAAELGISGTPVREALIRLAAERLVVYVPKKGFVVKTLSAAELHAIYLLNHTLLHAVLSTGQRNAGVESAIRHSKHGAADERSKLAHTAQRAAGLFLRIASEWGNEEFAAVVRNINDRLHHVRIAEAIVIDDIAQELSAMEALHDEDRPHGLQLATQRYHERRLTLLPAIHRELVLMPFTGVAE